MNFSKKNYEHLSSNIYSLSKTILFSIGTTALLIGCSSTKTATSTTAEVTKVKKDVTAFGETITSAELKDALYTYASDDFQGRETGEPGQKKAVEYLKKHYVALGIPSPIAEDDYFQEVPLTKQGTPEVTMSVNSKEFKAIDNYVPFGAAENGVLNTDEIVYAGYGIETDAFSSYDNIDVKGKVVLIKSGEPKKEDGNYVVSGSSQGTKWSNRQQYGAKQGVALSKGAKALLIYDAQIYPRVQQMGRSSGRISLKEKKKETPQMYFFFINETLAKTALGSIDTEDKAQTIKMPFSMNYVGKSKDISSENVLAFMKGSEKPDEILVISAHLDHEGVKDGKIYNGADDDGSGTVAILEIAEAFKAAADNGQTPKRSILFLHVTGEEKGLLGSRYYADMDPIFPLKNTVANLNIDMIGRSDPKRKKETKNYVYLIGSDKLSTELHNLSEEVNKKYANIDLDYTYNDENDPNRFYYRSDHYNFAKNDIPVIFYFNGTHADYHQPSDTPDKIEYDLLENRARLVFYTAWEIANRENRIVVDKPTKKAE